MATKAQPTANSSNSRTPAALETKPLFTNAEDQRNFLAHKESLSKQLLPVGILEEKLVHLYAFSLFQAERSQFLELAAEDAWLSCQTNPILIVNLQRLARYGEIHERRAARSLNELRKLQHDRFAAVEVREILAVQGHSIEISKALPMASIRKTNHDRTNPNQIAEALIAADPTIQSRPRPGLPAKAPIDWLSHYKSRGGNATPTEP